MTTSRRREFLLGVGGAVASLSGCLAPGPSGRRSADADVTLYVGSYHWGFVLIDGSGTERERVVLDRGTTIELVGFNTSADRAIERLPTAVRGAVPEHEELEDRNGETVPSPDTGDFHEALKAANDRYPDHSLAVMPSGRNARHGMSGMMLPSIPLPADATMPTTARITASQRGDFTLACLTYCGYGHPYMELDGALVVR